MEQYYRLLGCKADCSDEELKKKYRELALRFHPDKWEIYPDHIKAEYQKKFQQISEAYVHLREYREEQKIKERRRKTWSETYSNYDNSESRAQKDSKKENFRGQENYQANASSNQALKYFIVFYNYYGETSSGSGHTTFSVTGAYVNRKKIVDFLEGTLRKKYEEDFTIIIANVVNLSKEEYQAWVE